MVARIVAAKCRPNHGPWSDSIQERSTGQTDGITIDWRCAVRSLPLSQCLMNQATSKPAWYSVLSCLCSMAVKKVGKPGLLALLARNVTAWHCGCYPRATRLSILGNCVKAGLILSLELLMLNDCKESRKTGLACYIGPQCDCMALRVLTTCNKILPLRNNSREQTWTN